MKKTNLKKRILVVVFAVVIFLLAVFSALGLGTWGSANLWEHWRPTYAKVDISPLLQKSSLSDEDYATLYRQTGVTRLGVDELRSAGDERQLLTIQSAYFGKYDVTRSKFGPYTYIEYLSRNIPTVNLRNGDILLSASTYFSFFRFGHSVMVVDAEYGRIIESFSPGTFSQLSSYSSVTGLSNLIIVRPKCDEATREAVAAYAKNHLLGIPYSLTTGIFSKKYTEEIPKETQCTHVVWYAYKKHGIDLDSNGGLVVKPQDIARSNQVEVLQVFGFNPEKLW